ncbi:cbb3-type cytochrome c oxidase subunit 3 [Alkalicaulis satelles]|uniref:Cbb3-type cytochrome c oxidase subunit 3 n=1 Tax=Alkalicaulis satelles TaxID=2609175 RepID=A0A5M6ZKK7_9PROT|nr:cbb3-type cytochrome c oxidase subunit 3 [Alkalicaulis satelles]KAA5805366.1 cbb3-type cytochrome c oxidase subunit 3 [Alkalicaulis satelles]
MYESLAHFAQSWGLVAFMIFFAGVLVYALWPKNRDKFNAAARSVLEDNDRPDAGRPGADDKKESRDG